MSYQISTPKEAGDGKTVKSGENADLHGTKNSVEM